MSDRSSRGRTVLLAIFQAQTSNLPRNKIVCFKYILFQMCIKISTDKIFISFFLFMWLTKSNPNMCNFVLVYYKKIIFFNKTIFKIVHYLFYLSPGTCKYVLGIQNTNIIIMISIAYQIIPLYLSALLFQKYHIHNAKSIIINFILLKRTFSSASCLK